jgi:putative phage-type endonuclease
LNPFTYIHPDTFTDTRNTGIGASEIAVLCGASDYATPYEIWKQKIDNTTPEISDELQELFDAGHYQEPIAMHKFLKTRNELIVDLVRTKHAQKDHFNKAFIAQINTRFNHPQYDFMFCHPDLIYNNMNIEVKYAAHKSNEWDFDDLTENGIPLKYYLQVQYQMLCTGIDTSYLVLNYLGYKHYEFGPIFENKQIQAKMEKIAYDFWQLVQSKQPPMPVNRSDVMDMFPNKKFLTKTIPSDLEVLTIMQKDRYNVLKSRITKDKKEQDKIKASISALMTDNNVLQTQEGEIIAKISVSENEKIVREALKKIKSDHLDVYDLMKKKKLIETKTTERFYA